MGKDKKAMIEQCLNQILAAADSIQSAGIKATAENASQLMGIQRAVHRVWELVAAPGEEVGSDGK